MQRIVAVSLVLLAPVFAVVARADHTLVILPGDFTLAGPTARQTLVVEWIDRGVPRGQLDEGVTLASADEKVVRIENSVAIPVGNGETTITAFTPSKQAKVTVTVRDLDQPLVPSFRNQVQPILAATGCSSGACHGAAAGKEGFRLSLRGYDDEGDWRSITRHAGGRRVMTEDPGHSLLLLKPTGAVTHKGGTKIHAGSREYNILADWIASGTPGPSDKDPRIERIEVLPRQIIAKGPGVPQQLLVMAYFSDGSVQDVTPWAKYTAADTSVATVDDAGRVTVMGYGEGTITAWYLSRITTATITVPYHNHAPDDVFAKSPRRNFVDELVLEKLRQLDLPPSPRASDAEFMRRAFLDTIGTLPTAEEARAFLADAAPDKRDRLIESLLARPEYVDYWSYKWSDLLLVNSRKLKPPAMWAYYNWVREQVADNTPWDQFARKVVTATGGTLDNGAGNFFLLHDDPAGMSETTSQAFLGMSINCAKCHNHPMEKWTNDQYYGMANLFARVRTKNAGGEGSFVVFSAADGDLVQPLTGRPQPPAPLDGKPISLEQPGERRAHLADWLVAPENPYFARAITNRVWANFMGVGLVEAVDDMRKTNPASNEKLLDALAKHLIDSKYDMKALMRTILQSETYQRSSEPLKENAADRRFYSRYYPKRIMAEVLLDAMSQVAGAPTEFKDYPKRTRAVQLPDTNIDSYFLKAFGRPERVLTCECERTGMPSMAQALHIANGDTINAKLQAKGNRIEKLIAEKASDEKVIEELYLSALSRWPTDAEKKSLAAELAAAKDANRREVIEDLYWGVLSTNAFLFNH